MATGTHRDHIKKMICLAFLAPDLLAQITQGNQPVGVHRRGSRQTVYRPAGPPSAQCSRAFMPRSSGHFMGCDPCPARGCHCRGRPEPNGRFVGYSANTRAGGDTSALRFATRWLLRNRRYLGIASFCYALLHTLFYVLDAGSLSKMVSQLTRLDIWTGWLGLLIMVPLTLTSNDAAVRKLGRRWKTLLRWA